MANISITWPDCQSKWPELVDGDSGLTVGWLELEEGYWVFDAIEQRGYTCSELVKIAKIISEMNTDDYQGGD